MNLISGDTISSQASLITTTAATTAAAAPASHATEYPLDRWSTTDRSSRPSSTNSADSSRKISVRQNIVPLTRDAACSMPSVRVPR